MYKRNIRTSINNIIAIVQNISIFLNQIKVYEKERMSQTYKKIPYVLLTIFSVLNLSKGVSVNEVFGEYFGDTNYTRSEAEVMS